MVGVAAVGTVKVAVATVLVAYPEATATASTVSVEEIVIGSLYCVGAGDPAMK